MPQPLTAPSETTQPTYCAVMTSMEIDPKKAQEAGLFRDYEGKRYYFCCPGCVSEFDADPAKYAKN